MIKIIKKHTLKKETLLKRVNVLGIAASPRRNANSEVLLDSALAGARAKGAKTEKVVLNLLKIRPCQSCAKCSKTVTCYIMDDMRVLLRKLKNCDALIIASPVYFGTVTAQLKIMIDRCQPVWAEKYLRKKYVTKNRKGMFISVSSHNNKRFFRNSKEVINILFTVLGIRLSQEMYVPCLENKSAARNNSLLVKEALKRGQGLIASNPPRTR